MGIEENKELVRRWYEPGNEDVLSEDFVHHTMEGTTKPKKQWVDAGIRWAESGGKVSVEDIMAEGDRVYVFVRLSHSGNTAARNYVHKISEGKIVESWARGGDTKPIPGT